ncbi:MAG: hypothetical protein Q9202_006529 [Teloschistes flavicans]
MSAGFEYRILFIDAYDSFSNNIISLLETRLTAVRVTSINIHEQIAHFPTFLHGFDAVVAGPGPGHPANPADVGLISQLWQLSHDDMIPVLGICMGFQSLVTAFGGNVVPLPQPRHGIVRTIICRDASIFKGIDTTNTVQYHSLHALLRPSGTLHASQGSFDACNHLETLAWDTRDANKYSEHIPAHESNPDYILMAVKHKTKPFYGLQFHPESICSDEISHRIIKNWWSEIQRWNKEHRFRRRDHVNSTFQSPIPPSRALPRGLEALARLSPNPGTSPAASKSILDTSASYISCSTSNVLHQVTSQVLPLNGLTVDNISDIMNISHGEAVVLDSEPHQRPQIGTYSVIGNTCNPKPPLRMAYHVNSNKINLIRGQHTASIDLAAYDNDVFSYLKTFMKDHKAEGGNPNIPFWGGLVGNISYEACLETIGIRAPTRDGQPDMNFVFIEDSVVVDHQRQQIHVQSITSEGRKWVKEISSRIVRFAAVSTTARGIHPCVTRMHKLGGTITYPEASSYASKVRECQKHIHNGDSYELCLTTRAIIENTHRLSTAWPLYLQLRALNPAPFSAYIRIGRLTLLSTSPERFMSWTRPSTGATTLEGETRSIVQFRPIKGTVERYPNGPNAPAINLAQAKALLSTPKERAENLMIVDLIRHDLHGVVGSGNVCVPKLMVVEEYATLYQLVTVVEGTLITHCPSATTVSTPPSLTNSSRTSPSISRPSTPKSPITAATTTNPTPPELHEHTNNNNNQDIPQPPSTNLPPPPPPPPAPVTTAATTTTTKTGMDVLAASLPPGSMTGAPKRRSCALLRTIEDAQPRGVYSGVVGYMDVGGGGDFSVVIRSAFRWDAHDAGEGDSWCGVKERGGEGDGKKKKKEGDTWTVGAGGAVTGLSSVRGEWEEMGVKMRSTLRLFEAGGGAAAGPA